MKMKTAFASGLALLVWFALVLQLLILLQVRRAAGLSLGGGVGNFFSYFTVLTNLLVAVTLSVPLLWSATRVGQALADAGLRSGVAASIALVGLTYSLLLRALWQPQGAQWLADTLLHDAVPLLYLLLWAWVVPRAALGWRNALRWALYPLVYLVYALLRGAWLGRYPYPFIDVAQLGYARVAVNASGMLALFLLIAAGLIGLNRLKPRLGRER
jgi:preprotein translocase subunit SecG